MCSVRLGRVGWVSRTTKSTTSSAMARYVVHLPPATAVRPGATSVTVCSREILVEPPSDPVTGCSSGRRPAYVAITSSRVRSSFSTALACSRM